jgi:AraC-like DNA-binding protein
MELLTGIESARIVYGEGFALHQRWPGPALRGLVQRFTAYQSSGPLPGHQHETAGLTVPLIFVFEAGFDLALGRIPGPADRFQSFTAGLTAAPVMIRTPERVACLQVDFTPLGAMRFFGPGLGEAANRMVGLADLGDPGLADLGARLGELRDWGARLALLEARVVLRLAEAAAPPPELRRAWRLIEATGGRARIERIAAQVGWSRRHLATRFRDHAGLTPKTVARLARFGRAEARAGAQPRPDWAGIAADCGYADQAHLSRDFTRFAGLSPERWRAA